MNNLAKLFTLSFLALAPQAALAQAVNLEAIEQRIIELSNEARQKAGVPPLRASAHLRTAAVKHSEDMRASQFFAHTNPQTPLNTLNRRLQAAGSTSIACAENIFQCSGYKADELARVAVDGWLKSPGHRRNLLDPSFNRIGVGVSGDKNGYYFTQDFAKDAIEVVSYKVTRTDSGYQLHLNGRVVEGAKEGALLYQGKRVANWEANESGDFEVEAAVPALGELEIGQTVAPRQWSINAVVQLRAFD